MEDLSFETVVDPDYREQHNTLGITIAGRSKASIKHPDRNEDAIAHDESTGIAIVVDGVGGMAMGEKASRVVRGYVADTLRLAASNDIDRVKYLMSSALKGASQSVRQEVPGGGAVATALKVICTNEGKRIAIIGQVGDTRAYIYQDGFFSQITIDDGPIVEGKKKMFGLVNPTKSEVEMEAARISAKLDTIASSEQISRLSVQERRYWEVRNQVSHMLDGENVEPKIYTVELKEGDKVVLTSDGIHDNLTFNEISAVFNTNVSNPEEALVSRAVLRSKDDNHVRSKPDDMSVVVVTVGNLK